MGCDWRDGANLPEMILIFRSEPRTLHGDKELPPAHGCYQKPFLSKWKWCKPHLPNPLWTRGVWSDFSSFLRPCEAIQRSCVPLGVGGGAGRDAGLPGNPREGLGFSAHTKNHQPLFAGAFRTPWGQGENDPNPPRCGGSGLHPLLIMRRWQEGAKSNWIVLPQREKWVHGTQSWLDGQRQTRRKSVTLPSLYVPGY